MIQFLGIGSAFNTKLGNTSAYMKYQDTFVLIDCGGTVFHTLQEFNLLDEVKDLHIIITHTHPDHIGSLGDTIFYAFYILNIIPKIYYPDPSIINTILSCSGVLPYMYTINHPQVLNHQLTNEITCEFIPVSHLETVKAYGFILKQNRQMIYYSGDANTIPQTVLNLLLSHQLHALYQDTCGLEYEGNAHLSLNRLANIIPVEYRQYVHCIHHDQHLDIAQVKALGLNVPIPITLKQ